jgi:hypothetical protein
MGLELNPFYVLFCPKTKLSIGSFIILYVLSFSSPWNSLVLALEIKSIEPIPIDLESGLVFYSFWDFSYFIILSGLPLE